MIANNVMMLILSVCILFLIIYTVLSIPIVYANLFLRNVNSNIVFAHVPKTGGNSFIDTFSNINYMSHQDCLDNDYKQYKDKQKVTIVRNPYSRCVSGYSYLKKGGLGGPDLLCQMQISKYDTFKEFAKNLPLIAEGDDAILHLIHQHKFIDDEGKLWVDKIMKLENIDNEINNFCLENSLECPKRLKTRNKSKHKDYKEIYDKETQDLVYNFYKKDFDLFGYDYEL